MNKIMIFLILSIFLVTILILTYFLLSFKEQTIQDKELSATLPEEIRFLNPWEPEKGLQKILTEFMQTHPEIRVINESLGLEDYLLKLKTDFALGLDPDLFSLWPGWESSCLIETGKVARLNLIQSKFNNLKTWIIPLAWRLAQSGPHNSNLPLKGSIPDYHNRHQAETGPDYYSLPLDLSCEGLFIHRDLFASYNLKIPETYQELLTAIRTFRAAGIIPIAYNHSLEGSLLYQNIVAKLIGTGDATYLTSDREVHPAFIRGMYIMRDLYNLQAFPADALLLENYARDKLFLTKKAAMLVQGSWFISDTNESEFTNTIGLVPFPSFDDKPAHHLVVYGLGSGNIYISRRAWEDSDKWPAILTFLETLITDSSIRYLSENTGFICSFSGFGFNSFPLQQDALQMITRAEESIRPLQQVLGQTYWEQEILSQFPLMLIGKVSPEDIFMPEGQ